MVNPWLIGLAISFMLIVIPAVASQWVNDYDQSFVFQCPRGKSISRIRSRHSNGREDRQFAFNCRRTQKLKHCKWHGYANKLDAPFLFQCPRNGVISGVNSYHDNGTEDRRFKFNCCYLKRKMKLINCAFSDYTNNFDTDINYRVHAGRVLKGVSSYHHNGAEDRRFKFETCTVRRC